MLGINIRFLYPISQSKCSESTDIVIDWTGRGTNQQQMRDIGHVVSQVAFVFLSRRPQTDAPYYDALVPYNKEVSIIYSIYRMVRKSGYIIITRKELT